MFIRVKSRVTGHQFDVHEEQVDESVHERVEHCPPSKRVRRTKFRVGKAPALSVSPKGKKEVSDGASDS